MLRMACLQTRSCLRSCSPRGTRFGAAHAQIPLGIIALRTSSTSAHHSVPGQDSAGYPIALFLFFIGFFLSRMASSALRSLALAGVSFSDSGSSREPIPRGFFFFLLLSIINDPVVQFLKSHSTEGAMNTIAWSGTSDRYIP